MRGSMFYMIAQLPPSSFTSRVPKDSPLPKKKIADGDTTSPTCVQCHRLTTVVMYYNFGCIYLFYKGSDLRSLYLNHAAQVSSNFKSLNSVSGRKVIGISGSLIWSKTLMELIFNPCGEFRWSPEGPVSQVHSHLHAGVPGIFSDLLRYVRMLKGEWDNGKLPHLFNPW